MFANQNRKNAASAKPNGPVTSRRTYASRMRSPGKRGGAARASGGATPGTAATGLAEAGDHALDVRARLGIRRNAVRGVDRSGACIVGRDRQADVSAIAPQQVVQIARPALDVLVRIERIRHPVFGGGS